MKVNFKSILPIAFALILVFVRTIHVNAGNFEDALKLAKEQNKKVIVDVYTDWCGWCKKMDRDTYSNSDINDIIKNNFIYVKLNAESSALNSYKGKLYTEADLAALFQVSGFPTHVFLEPDGSVIEFNYDKYNMNNLPGYMNAKNFKKILEYFRDEKYKDTDLSTIL